MARQRADDVLYLVGRGLLGSGVAAAGVEVSSPLSIPWSRPDDAAGALRRLATEIPQDGAPWAVAWCAGASTMRSSAADLRAESGHLAVFLDELRLRLTPAGVSAGVIFLASSAGGIYGAGAAGTITEASAETPTTAYADGKLAQEELLARFHRHTSVRCLAGRISNLYGTTQNLLKAQGLVSHVCRAALYRRHLTVTVPLDTRRDYIHSVDAGHRITRWIDAARQRPSGFETKLIVSGRSATVAEIINSVKRVARIQPLIVYAHPVDDGAPRYQHFRSIVATEVDQERPCRSLETGISEVWRTTWGRFVNPPTAPG